MAGADSDSDDVEIVEAPWEQVVLQNRDYKDAYNIFIGRKHGSPGLDKMRDLLFDSAETQFFKIYLLIEFLDHFRSTLWEYFLFNIYQLNLMKLLLNLFHKILTHILMYKSLQNSSNLNKFLFIQFIHLVNTFFKILFKVTTFLI